MRMIRGAGDRGLKGMDVCSELAPGIKLIRPLLGVSRRAIAAFARREGIAYVEDSSNRGGRYYRNRVRHLVLPRLKKGDRRLAEEVSAECEQYRRRYEADRKIADEFLSTHPNEIPLGRYFQLPDSVRFLVLEALLKRNGFEKELNRCHVTEIEGLLQRPAKCSRAYGKAHLSMEEGVFSVASSVSASR